MDTNLRLNKPKTVEEFCFSDEERKKLYRLFDECYENTENSKVSEHQCSESEKKVQKTCSTEDIETIEKVLKSVDEELLLRILERQIKHDFVHSQK